MSGRLVDLGELFGITWSPRGSSEGQGYLLGRPVELIAVPAPDEDEPPRGLPRAAAFTG